MNIVHFYSCENRTLMHRHINVIGISGVGESLDKDTIAKLKRETDELKENFERERKDIEQSYKLEIAAIEGKHDEEKGEILKNIDKDKVLYNDGYIDGNKSDWDQLHFIDVQFNFF